MNELYPDASNDVEAPIARALARAIFLVSNEIDANDKDAIRSAWENEKAAKTKMARQIIRRLNAQGFNLSQI